MWHTPHDCNDVPQEDFTMSICLIFLSESLLTSFWIFLPVPKDNVSVILLLRHDGSKQTEEWKLHFARKCLARKWHIKHGEKCIKHYTWPTSLKCKCQLAVAQQHKNTGCWQILSLPPETSMHRNENDNFIQIFWRNDFITGLTAWQIMPNA